MKNEYEQAIKKLKEVNVALERAMRDGKEKFITENVEKVVTQ